MMLMTMTTSLPSAQNQTVSPQILHLAQHHVPLEMASTQARASSQATASGSKSGTFWRKRPSGSKSGTFWLKRPVAILAQVLKERLRQFPDNGHHLQFILIPAGHRYHFPLLWDPNFHKTAIHYFLSCLPCPPHS